MMWESDSGDVVIGGMKGIVVEVGIVVCSGYGSCS